MCKAHAQIEKVCKFSKTEELGYVTSLPKDLGFFELEIVLEIPTLYDMLKHSD
jgi:hypothetical protein